MGSAFKLDSLAAVAQREEEGQWVDVKHPDGELLYLGGQKEQPLRIRVAGSYSKTYRDVEKRNREAAIKKRGRSSADDLEKREVSTLAACTLEWAGAFDDAGTPIPLTKENAQTLYTVARFIAEQVDEAIGDHARFFEKSSPI